MKSPLTRLKQVILSEMCNKMRISRKEARQESEKCHGVWKKEGGQTSSYKPPCSHLLKYFTLKLKRLSKSYHKTIKD